MQQGLPISVVIPTFESAAYLPALHNSIINGPMAPVVQEIIYVVEGNDNSEKIISEFEKLSTIPLQVIRPKKRLGKFLSRLEGAKLAKCSRVLLLDSRVTLPERAAKALKHMPEDFRLVLARLDLDETKNIFCLYWQRTHEKIFYRNFISENEIVKMTPETFDKYVTGTTFLYIDRDLFVQGCENLKDRPMYSDDTFLLKELSRKTDIILHPEIAVRWEPRREWWKFLKHLYDRGPGFAEYHIFEHRGWLFYLVLTGSLCLLAILTLLFVRPELALLALGLCTGVMFLSTAIFVKSFKEFWRLAPLHTMVLVFYGLGAMNGIRVISLQRCKK